MGIEKITFILATHKMDKALNYCVQKLETLKNEVENDWKIGTTFTSPRHGHSTQHFENALKASKDNLALAKKLTTLPKNEVLAELFSNFKHCEKWEKQFHDWGNGLGGRDKNNYAEKCHRIAKETFHSAHDALKALN